MTEYTTAMGKKGLIVSPIENGTVIDHLPPGTAVKIATMLGLMDGAVVIIGQNLRSTKYGKKDLIKVEDRFIGEVECNKIALLAPNATVNIVRGSAIAEKRNVEVPELVEEVALCGNANCITNREKVPTRLHLLSRSPLVMACYYCGHETKGEELRLK